jgi:hypothetical protein
MSASTYPRFGFGMYPAPEWSLHPEVRRSAVADGIEWIDGPRHRGFRLSRARYDRMPDHLKACSFDRNEFFEEDCSWCAVVIAFPECFKEAVVKMAHETYNGWYNIPGVA